MNQILSVEMPRDGKKGNKASIKSVTIVFAIILLLFGIGLVSTGGYGYYKNLADRKNSGLELSANTKPIITIERVDTSIIKIVATHDKEIASIVYNFEGEEEVEIKGQGENTLETEIELPVGESKINIIAKDINGISNSYMKDFTVDQKPKIKLEKMGSQIQATIESPINIAKISYYWDEDKENEKTLEINDTKTRTLIDVLVGNHTLNISAVDIEGNETIKNQKVIGDNKPTLNITTDGTKFFIEAEDDEGLSKIQIKLNSNDTIEEELTEKTYKREIELQSGENKLTVRVYNKNDIAETKKVKSSKE